MTTTLARTQFAQRAVNAQRAVYTVRTLAAGAMQRVGDGHPGTAMSLAGYVIFQRFVRHESTDPEWTGREHFVPSSGHRSLTPYIQLYRSGSGHEVGVEKLGNIVALYDNNYISIEGETDTEFGERGIIAEAVVAAARDSIGTAA